jgi:Tol biopolymer transport system component/predicted Ser/Thr protein kinase
MALKAGSLLGSYEVVSALGAGGMGEVYRAKDARLGRDVAIKTLPSGLAQDAERLRRFEREARAASSLNHPNIVTIYEIGRVDGSAYIVMELIDGETLRSLMHGEPIPTRKLLGIAAQIAEGLAKAHAAGMTHRDLKPENVMVTGDGVVKILDFGLAKLTQQSEVSGPGTALPTASVVTDEGVIMGTVAYMSPEQARGSSVDFRSDQFSFGTLLYEMATGKRAFNGESHAEVLSAILRDEPQPVASHNPKVPAPLRWIIERCLGKEPKDRYAATEDLARDLATVRDRLSEATSSGPAIAAESPRWGLRRMASAAALPLATLLLGLAAGWFALRPPLPSAPRFQRVTFRQANIYSARFGPDGQSIFYGAAADGGPVEIFMTRLGSRESRPLGLAPASVWSVSSGGEIAVLMGRHMRGGRLGRVSLAGGTPREILEHVSSADWAPDGKSLAVVRTLDGKKRLEFPIGKVLYEPKASAGFLRVSPRGDLVAFSEDRSLAVVDLKGNRRDLVKDVEGWCLWSPDGSELWFNRFGAGTTGIYAVTLRGKERLVASLPGGFTPFDLSKDNRLLVEKGGDRIDVAGRFSGDKEDRDLSWQDATIPGDFSADGKALLFSEKEPSWNQSEVYLRKADGSSPVHLGRGFGRALSPDGKWAIVLTASRSPNLVVMPTGAGEARTLPNDGLEPLPSAHTIGCGWLPDGKRIVFTASAVGHGPQLWVQDVSGGKPRAFSAEGVEIPGSTSPVSPDGMLVFATGPEGVAFYPVDGSPPRPIPGLSKGESLLRWSADGKSLYLVDDDLKIWLLDVANGKRRLWKELRPPGRASADDFFSVLLTPDGQGYVQTYQRWLSDLYVVDGLK